MIKIVILSTLAALTAASKCPDLPSLDTFDSTQYVGQWYEIARYPLFWEIGETCAQANYTLQADGSIRVENRGRKRNGDLDSISGTARVIDPAHPGALSLVFDEGFRGTYNVIRTDYSGSALVYSCGTTLGIRIEFAWVLARTPQLEEAKVEEYKALLAQAGSNSEMLKMTEQNCGSYF